MIRPSVLSVSSCNACISLRCVASAAAGGGEEGAPVVAPGRTLGFGDGGQQGEAALLALPAALVVVRGIGRGRVEGGGHARKGVGVGGVGGDVGPFVRVVLQVEKFGRGA